MNVRWVRFFTVSIAASLLLALWSRNVTFPGLTSDSFRYLLIADAWAMDASGAVELNAWYWLDSQFPPLYSLVLHLVGAGAESIHPANVLNALLLGVGFGLFGVYLTQIRVSEIAIVLALCALIVSRAVLLQAPQVLSEHLYIALSMLALLCLCGQGRTWLLAAATVVAIAVMTRAVGVALVPAVMFVARRESWPVKLALPLVMLAPLLIWTTMRGDLAGLSGNAGYSTLIANILQPESAGSIFATISENVAALTSAWNTYWLPAGSTAQLITAPLGMVAVVGLYGRLRSCGPEAIYSLFYLAILLVWPGSDQAQRFLFALIPALMVALAVGMDKLFSALPSTRWPVALLVVAISTVGVADLVRRELWESPAELDGYRRLTHWQEAADHASALESVERLHAIINTLRAASNHVPEGDCIYTQYPEWVATYSRRFGVPVPIARDVDKLRDAEQRQCNFLFVTDTSTRQFPYPEFYPAQRLRDSLSPILTVTLPGAEGDHLVAALAEFR